MNELVAFGLGHERKTQLAGVFPRKECVLFDAGARRRLINCVLTCHKREYDKQQWQFHDLIRHFTESSDVAFR